MPQKNVVIGQRPLALDARPDRLDLRDRPFQPPLGNLPAEYPTDAAVQRYLPAYAEANLLLDQGSEGACTGFGLAAVINYLRFTQAQNPDTAAAALRRVSPAMLYQLARLYDEWPGEDYEGSSCRGALKGWHRHGVCSDQLWPYVLKDGARVFTPPKEDAKKPDDAARNWDVDALGCALGVYYRVDARSIVDMQAAICMSGAIYVSATVHEGWNVPSRKQLRGHADLVRISAVPKPKDGGGHAFALVGYNQFGFVVQNSWGRNWGSHGFALLPYEDWVTHGDDVWVFTLGVPRQQAVIAQRRRGERTLRSPRFYVPSAEGETAASLERAGGMIAGDDALTRRYRTVPAAVRPLESDLAYRHTLVLDRGFAVRNDITAEDSDAAMEGAVLTRPLDWLQANHSHKLLIYAHGGLNSEGASIARIRALAPYALSNGIYPLFLTWRSGGVETVSDLVEELFAKMVLGTGGAKPARGWLDRIAEKTDRMLEPVLRTPGGAMWGQMKLNAVRASTHAEGGLHQMVKRLRLLAAKWPRLEIHLIGHSAGAILIGAMLRQFEAAQLKVASLRLFAPACTARFALEHYVPAVQAGVIDARHWHIHVLSDKNERDDSVGPYRKSLLYLVSRAFEDTHKTPLLGLHQCFEPATVAPGASDDLWAADCVADAREWQAFWAGMPGADERLHVLSQPSVSTGAGGIASSHGCFDNAVDIMGQALGYVSDPAGAPKIRIHRLDY